ncbi:Rv0909 family putative TA system antitoxin [Streptomyces sp. NPDC058947]|uniref:antitoxin n=1 Tax=Streptomyces sp. NPDC058947 TaxID=3346675 RepID=UPI0036B50110
MGLLENVKAKLGPAKGKVSHLAQRHEDRIQHGLDRAAQVVDKRTKGKYSDRIHSGTGKAKGAMGRLAHKDDGGPHTGGAAPTPDAATPSQGGATPPQGAATAPQGGATPPADADRTAPPRDAAGGTPPDNAPPPVS